MGVKRVSRTRRCDTTPDYFQEGSRLAIFVSMVGSFTSKIKTPIRHTSTAFHKIDKLVGSQGLKYIEKDTPNVNACAEIRFQK